MSTIPPIPDSPRRRYGALSDMLSGVQLIESPPEPPSKQLLHSSPLFCNRWTADDIAQTLFETGTVDHWKKQGFRDLLVEVTPSDIPSRHAFNVWTTIDNAVRELLAQVVVWIEKTHLDDFNLTIPTFCVEHLRLQNPNITPSKDLLPGQDFHSSGQLHRIFGILRYWATCTGARAITEIPEYFHTAYIFSRHFTYADKAMESTFRAMCRDLLPPLDGEIPAEGSLRTAVARVSHAFEDGRVRRNGSAYYWPTELQIYALDRELEYRLQRDIEPENASFTIS